MRDRLVNDVISTHHFDGHPTTKSSGHLRLGSACGAAHRLYEGHQQVVPRRAQLHTGAVVEDFPPGEAEEQKDPTKNGSKKMMQTYGKRWKRNYLSGTLCDYVYIMEGFEPRTDRSTTNTLKPDGFRLVAMFEVNILMLLIAVTFNIVAWLSCTEKKNSGGRLKIIPRVKCILSYQYKNDQLLNSVVCWTLVGKKHEKKHVYNIIYAGSGVLMSI